MSFAPGYSAVELASWLPDVIRVLNETGTPFALAGGGAVLVYGRRPRTRDLDFFVDVDAPAWQALATAFRAHGFRVESKSSWQQRVWAAPYYADILLAEVDLQREAVHAARPHALAGVETRVVPPEHLIALKVVAGRPRDQLDVEDLRLNVPDLDHGKIAELLAPFDLAWP